jgi:hypothetical protein
MILPDSSSSQTDSEDSIHGGVDPVAPLNDFIKLSTGIVQNKLFYDGKLYGYKNGERVFIKDFRSQETFSFETGNYDSVQFYYEWENYIVDGFFLKVNDNKPFTFEPVPVQELSGLEMVTDNVKKFKGKKLYEVSIFDDVNPGQIEVTATNESFPYIYIDTVKIDTAKAIYQIKLKGKYEFSRDVSPEIQKSIGNGEEVTFPIGIIMTDKSVKSDVQEYKIFLKKKKKPKVKK